MIAFIVGLVIGLVGGLIVGIIYQKKIGAAVAAGKAVVEDVKKI